MTSKRNRKLVKALIKSLCFCNPDKIVKDVVESSAYNTYVETVGGASDTIHHSLNDWDTKSIEQTYSLISENQIKKMHLGLCDVSIDATEEAFYGDVKGLWIHPWTREHGIEGHFKFLVCSVKYRNKKYVLFVRILRIGTNIPDEIGYILDSCKRAGIKIKCVMMDRGFYSAENIDVCQKSKEFFLIFARKSKTFSCMLEGINRTTTIEHKMTYLKNKSTFKVDTEITLVKNVKGYDWVFATNLDLKGWQLVRQYRCRWNIETDFRVQDEARIKSKSVRPEVRLFYFLISCILMSTWNIFVKEQITFKRFIIEFKKELEIEARGASI